MFGELLVRGILALVVANLFIFGIYLSLRGYFINYALKRSCIRKKATLIKLKRKKWQLFTFKSTISWNFRGESILGVEANLFTIRNKDTVIIYLFPGGYKYKLDTWSQNGKGLVALGITLCLIAFSLFLILL